VASPSLDQRNSVLAATALLVLFAAGIVLALSWAVAFPGEILATAWLVALLAMAVVTGNAFREARSARIGFLAAVGRSFKALGRFVLWFF
jgi:hypothetical protein